MPSEEPTRPLGPSTSAITLPSNDLPGPCQSTFQPGLCKSRNPRVRHCRLESDTMFGPMEATRDEWRREVAIHDEPHEMSGMRNADSRDRAVVAVGHHLPLPIRLDLVPDPDTHTMTLAPLTSSQPDTPSDGSSLNESRPRASAIEDGATPPNLIRERIPLEVNRAADHATPTVGRGKVASRLPQQRKGRAAR